MTTSEREVVAVLGHAIARRISEPRYLLWFSSNTKFHHEDGLLTVGVPNLFLQEYLQNKFSDAVRDAAAEVFGAPVQVRFVIDPELFQAARRDQQEATRTEPARSPARTVPVKEDPKPRRTRRWHCLDTFVVGPCNRLAHAAAVSLVEDPGLVPNPLVLHGPVGTGKTHLLEGICIGLRRRQPHSRILCMTAEEFTNRFVQAMRTGKLAAFRKQFRECDGLLVDDLHFLAGKQATQEEFLHTFNALEAAGKPVVVTCDCHPKLEDELPPELTDRLMGGAVWALAPPDRETRLALLRAKARQGEPPVPEAVLALLADQLRGNVRELEGALNSLRHSSRVAGQPIDAALARQTLAEYFRHAIRAVQLGDVEQAVCRVLHLEPRALQSKERSWAVSHPRMLAMYLARKHTTAAYSEIGQHFGGRNHSTAVAAEKKIRHWLQQDGALNLGGQRIRLREAIELVERELL